MHDQNLSNICTNVIKFFSKKATEINKEVGFSQRTSKITPQLFAQSLVLGCFSDPLISLEGLCSFIKKKKVSATKSALHQRFTLKAVELMKRLFHASLEDFQSQKTHVIDLLKVFSSVYLIDSTGISLPASMKDTYKGVGGGASEAGLKIQVLINYIKGQIESLTITDAIKSDQGFTGYLEHIQEGCLYLQDLGYFSLKTFTKIATKKAYFISRFLTQTHVYDSDGVVINLLKELRKTQGYFTKKVQLKNNLVVRMVGYPLPDAEVEKRIKRIKKGAKKRGHTPKEISLELAKWSMCITNVDECMLPDEHLYLVYTLRWQIELFFKLCKSEAGIDKIQGKTTSRVLCEIYAKLICTVMLMYLCFPQRWQNDRELSYVKAYKIFRRTVSQFCLALSSRHRFMKLLKEFFIELQCFALKEKPNKQKTITYQALMKATGQGLIIC